MEEKKPQPTPQQGKAKKNMAPLIIIIVLVLVIIPIVAGLLIWNSARKSIGAEIIKKGLSEIEKVSQPTEVIDDASNRVDPTLDGTVKDEGTDEGQDAWMNDFDIEIRDLEVVEEEYTHTSKLEVIVINKTNERKTLQIKIDAMDPEGFRINHDGGYIYDLGPGQKEKIELFKYFSANQLEAMKTATFEVSEVAVY